MRRLSLLLILVTPLVAGCSRPDDLPELDATVSPAALAADWPEFLPSYELLADAEARKTLDEETLQAMLAQVRYLEERARRLAAVEL